MMKVILLVASIGVICQAAPGGYTAKGGVYHFGKQPSYMADAAHAGKQLHRKILDVLFGNQAWQPKN